MDTLIILVLAAVCLGILVIVVMSHRKRLEVLDLTEAEYRYIRGLQTTSEMLSGDEVHEPMGPPILDDPDHRPIAVFRNGIQARFAMLDEIQLVRPSTGIQRRYVVRHVTRFYPWEMIAGIYPMNITIVRKMGAERNGFHVDGPAQGLASALNKAMAYADDGPDASTRKERFTTLQVETTDFRTSILSPSISRGQSNVRALTKAIGTALGPRAREKVMTSMGLHGFYMILEELGHYDTEHHTRDKGGRSRILLGDIHKHYVLRSRPGYPERRRQALQTLNMRDISTLDERLRT